MCFILLVLHFILINEYCYSLGTSLWIFMSHGWILNNDTQFPSGFIGLYLTSTLCLGVNSDLLHYVYKQFIFHFTFSLVRRFKDHFFSHTLIYS